MEKSDWVGLESGKAIDATNTGQPLVRLVKLLVGILLCAVSTWSQAQSNAGLSGRSVLVRGEIIKTRSAHLPANLQWVGPSSPSDAEIAEIRGIFDRSAKDRASSGLSSLELKKHLVRELEVFLSTRPRSSYGPAIRAVLAKEYTGRTRYTKALDHWNQAAEESRGLESIEGRNLHDLALAQGALLSAYLGDLAEVEAAIELKGESPLQGGVAMDSWNRAMEVYRRLKQRPELGFRCGVFALGQMARAAGAEFNAPRLYDERSSVDGLSLLDLDRLGDAIGFAVVPVRIDDANDLVVPSVVHYNQEHFVALTRRERNAVEVKDPSTGRTRWVDVTDVMSATTGYFLIEADQETGGWVPISDTESAEVIGRGSACLVLDDEDGLLCVVGRNGLGGSTPQGSLAEGEACDTCYTIKDVGMAAWRVSEPFLNLWIEDTPLAYQPALGGEVFFTLGHRQRVGDNPDALFQDTSFGHGWHSTWTSKVTLAGSPIGGVQDVTVAHPGGRLGWYTFTSAAATESEDNYWDNSKLIRILSVGQIVGYHVEKSDGSRSEYMFEDIDSGDYYLTANVSPEGFVTAFSYDASDRLEWVQDASGNKTFLKYQHSSQTNLVTGLDQTMLLGGLLQTNRTVSLSYSQIQSTWRLTGITDPVGISSNFGYDSNGWISSLTTPYGTTGFSYVESGTVSAQNPPSDPFERWVFVSEPEGLESTYAAIDFDAAGVPTTFSSSQFPAANEDLDGGGPGTELFPSNTLDLPLGGTPGFATSRRNRNTFYWNPQQWASLGTTNTSAFGWAEFKRARIRHWLWEDQEHIDTLSYEQAPSPDGVVEGQVTFYDYAGKQETYKIGTQIQPSIVARKLPDGTIWYRSFTRNSLGYVESLSETYTASNGGVDVRTKTYSYDPSNEIDLLNETDFNGNPVRSFTYNGKHQLTSASLHADSSTTYVTSFLYDAQDRLSNVSYPTGLTRIFEYGTDGYLKQVDDAPAGRTEMFTWAEGELDSHTDARGFLREFSFDGLGRLSRIDYPDQTYESFGYTANGTSGGAKILDLTSVRDRMGNTTEYRYDGVRRLVEKIDANNHITKFDYCDCGALERITDALNHETVFHHDYHGNRTQIVFPNGEGVIDFSYNDIDQLVSVSNGSVTRNYAYTNQGLLDSVTNLGSGTEFSARYDLNNRPTSVTDEHGMTTTRTFDRLGRLLTRTDPFNGVESFVHSSKGLESYTDPLFKTTLIEYDEERRPKKVTNPNSEIISMAYDPSGNWTRLTNGKGKDVIWNYDSEGRLSSKTDPSGQTILTLTYDVLGRTATRVDALQQLTTYGYDAVGNLESIDYDDATPDVTLTYTDRNELKTMTDGFGLTTFAYTPSGLLDSEDGPSTDDLVDYSYDSARRRDGMILAQPTGSWVQDYHYDGASRLQSIQANSGTFTYHYPTGAGPLAATSGAWERLDLPGGHIISQMYDNLVRLSQTELKDVSNVALNRHSYTYNSRHQRTRQTFLSGNYVDYGYDNLGQLKSAIGREASSILRLHEQLAYEYDDAWNLEERTQNQMTTMLMSDSRNAIVASTRIGTATISGMASSATSSVQINDVAGTIYSDQMYVRAGVELNEGLTEIRTTAVSTGSQTATDLKLVNLPISLAPFSDANGNLRGDGSRTFEYDSENRLIVYEEAEKVKINFTYDGFGRLRQRNTHLWAAWLPGWQTVESVQFIYDGMMVVQERSLGAPATPLVTYTRGLDLSGSLAGAGGIGGLLAYTDHTTGTDRTAFYHADGNGNITAMINQSGKVVSRYHYDPYGNLLGMAGPLAQLNRYRYSSKEAQPYAELYYYGYRFYDPSLQRWINQDPIGEAGGINLFRFVSNDPINRIDPYGEEDTNRPPVMIVLPTQGGTLKPVAEYGLPYQANPAFNPNHGLTVFDVGTGLASTAGSIFVEPYDWYLTSKEIYADPSNPWSYAGLWPGVPAAAGKAGKEICEAASKAPSLSAHKKALKEVQKEVGKLPKGKPGKWDTPQAGDKYKGYRLDEPHPPSEIHPPGSAGTKKHFDWWDRPSGKRKGPGSRGGKVPIED